MNNELLRHYVATLSFRASVAFQDAPPSFPTFEAGEGVRSPLDILNHMSNVLSYVRKSFGEEVEFEEVSNWNEEVERFYHFSREDPHLKE
ncbi:hypothetical protein [Bacillus sp. CGMCC 1.16541]|uniref:hypothetical protein n=1 Tax=Bacillus sp. CGMCC 1.16541 TaxID=2185143 RepID=UPI000D72CA8A|nr:hypothetical protein [Bacillus sp. CGMCC 1.16541]